MEREKALALALEGIEKQFGSGSVMKMGDKTAMSIRTIPTGSLNLDLALGVGGLPRGRIVEIYGPESCLDADTLIMYEVKGADGFSDYFEETIEEMWLRGNQANADSKENFYTSSVNEYGRIFKNRILNIIKTGQKPCHVVTLSTGETITATAEHKFFSNGRFVPLSLLRVGSVVAIDNGTWFQTAGVEDCSSYPEELYTYLYPSHPIVSVKEIRTNSEEDSVYPSSVILTSRAVMEAHVNGLTLKEYTDVFMGSGKCSVDDLLFLSPDDHVSHIDEDFYNNSLSNLRLVTASEYEPLRSMNRHNNIQCKIIESVITSISDVGVRDTYDIRMVSPFNNYIAAGFIVHNSGKSTLAMHVVAEAQRNGGTCAYIDAEHAMDPVYAKAIGVDIDELFISQPDTGEQGLEITDMLVRSGALDVIVIDSVAALTPRAEIEGAMGDTHVGLQARLMSQALRKLTGNINKTDTVVIFINQLREKIGVQWGSPETTPGGRALKFYSSVRLDIRRIESIKDGTEFMGNKTRVKVVKNKVAPPFKQAEFDIMYGEGISREGGVLDLGVEYEILKKAGGHYSFGEVKLGNGREKAKLFLSENPIVMVELCDLIIAEVNSDKD